ncbi:hypothetical protein ACJJZF_000829 [Escherichia coli]
MTALNKQAYRADGGDIGAGRLKEIADNAYGDEEKRWLAHRVLALLDELEAKEEQRANWFQMAQKLGEDLDIAEKRIADQHGIILSARNFISEYAQNGDVGAAEFVKILDRAAGIGVKGE